MKFRVHYPEDMSEIYKKMNEFKAKKIIRECTPEQVEMIIRYLKQLEETKDKDNKEIG